MLETQTEEWFNSNLNINLVAISYAGETAISDTVSNDINNITINSNILQAPFNALPNQQNNKLNSINKELEEYFDKVIHVLKNTSISSLV